jgi:LAS superfamily LD-carboxypeptidase LdcB
MVKRAPTVSSIKLVVWLLLMLASTRAQGAGICWPSAKMLRDTCLTREELMGLVDSPLENGFIKLPAEYSSVNVLLRAEVGEAYMRMADSAQKCGVTLNVLSGFRSFDRQVRIWQRKWERYHSLPDSIRVLKILQYSMLPGASRHHWGTEVDLNSMTNNYFLSAEGKQVYEWLAEHAWSFGFYQPYKYHSDTDLRVNEERWHWSYFPLSSTYLICWNELNIHAIIDESSFSGFKWAQKLNAFQVFANRIDQPKSK